ncbi:hypothetical protein BGX27_005400, partial [Mortierella sp. AM989]
MATKKTTKTTITKTQVLSQSSKDAKTKTSAPSSLNVKRISTIFVAITVVIAALSYNFINELITDFGLLLGTVQPFNTQGCEVVGGLEACEDVHIHHDSGLAFTTCGHAESRKN